MKEYKLSAKSKYSVFYLLSGLFMFFFMFAILNLSSYAQTGSYSISPNTDSTGFEYTFKEVEFSSSYYHADYSFPYTSFRTYLSFSTGSSTYVRNISLELHLVTSVGDFVVEQCQGTGTSETHSGVKVEGYPICYYAILKGNYVNNTSSTVTVTCTYTIDNVSVSNEPNNVTRSLSSISSDTTRILNILGSSSSDITIPNTFSDYSSYSPVSVSATFETFPAFGQDKVPAGSLFSFYLDNYSGSTLSFADWINFSATAQTHFVYVVNFDVTTRLTSAPFLELWVRGSSGGNLYTLTNPTFVYTGAGTGYYNYTVYFEFDLPDVDNFELYRIYMADSSSGYTFSHPSYMLLAKKYTIEDYMKFAQSQWDNISPSVTDTNTNIAQSVSDIGTAQTFETSAFTNFNNQFSSSGLDSFSLSFASTPLLWVSSVITTFYNNMPSTFQYLLMFVAFIGILCTVLNVFGRVAQRFGGGDTTRLNSKDVFSKIEKNGSI